MSVFLSSRPLSAPSARPPSTSRPPAALLHAGTVGVGGGHVSRRRRGVVVMMVVVCRAGRHGLGPAPEHGRRVVHVHVLVATPRCCCHGAEPCCRGGKYGGRGRQTGCQFSRLGEVCDVHVHVDVGLVEAGDGGPVTVHLRGVVQHRSQARHLQQRPRRVATVTKASSFSHIDTFKVSSRRRTTS